MTEIVLLKPVENRRELAVHKKEAIVELLKYYRPFWTKITIVLFLVVVTMILSMYPAFVLGQIINGVSDGKDFAHIFMLAVIMFGVRAAYMVVANIRIFLEINWLDSNIPMHINRLTMQTLKKLSVGQLYGQDAGKITSVISRGESAIQRLVYSVVYDLSITLCNIVIALIAILVVDWIVGLVVLICFSLYATITFLMSAKLRKRMSFSEKLGNTTDSKFREILNNMFLIKTSAKEHEVGLKHSSRLGRVRNYHRGLWNQWMRYDYCRDAVAEIGQFLIIVTVVYFIMIGRCNPGDLVIFWTLTSRALYNLQPLSRLQKEIMKQIAAIRRYFALVHMKPSVEVSSNPVIRPRIHGDIEFREVSFTYPKSNLNQVLDDPNQKKKEVKTRRELPLTNPLPTIQNVSLSIKSGETVALVGKTGSGKSTLISLLLRGYDPDRGVITVDGYDLRSLDLDSYRSSIGVVEQKVSLFCTTLRENILFGLPSGIDPEAVSPEELMDICRQAHITEFWSRLGEKGLNTVIGEDGLLLSGGQRQRVGIARALIKKPSLLILDEATSNLDAMTEGSIVQAIEDTSAGRTTIIIAHRLSTVVGADKIVVFDKGRIVRIGTHQDLLKNCEIYQELVRRQLQV